MLETWDLRLYLELSAAYRAYSSTYAGPRKLNGYTLSLKVID